MPKLHLMGKRCAAGECGVLLRPGSASRHPTKFGGQTYCSTCVVRRRAWLAKRRDRIAQEERESA